MIVSREQGDPDATALLDALEEEQILLRFCADCGATTLALVPTCVVCGSDRGRTGVAAGKGTVYTWTTCHRAFDPQLADDVPYTVALIELDEGARVAGRLVGLTSFNLEPGLSVRLRPTTFPSGRCVLTFAPAGDDGGAEG